MCDSFLYFWSNFSKFIKLYIIVIHSGPNNQHIIISKQVIEKDESLKRHEEKHELFNLPLTYVHMLYAL